jgi:phosphoserine phosphatase RsbU/P
MEELHARVETHLKLRRLQIELEETNAQLSTVNGRMSRDLEVAARIQEAFLPCKGLGVPGVDFAWIYQPCDELAGDGLCIVPLGDGKFGLCVLDVSGHGVASALLSVTLSRLLSPPSEPSSILIRDGDRGGVDIAPPAEVAARLNRLFPFDPATEQLTTMVYGILNASTGEFRYVSAGHPGPVHLPSRAEPVILESEGFPIGLADDEAYEERSVRLGAGDRLYIYSDGVPEAMNPDGKQFGNVRLLEAIAQGRSETLQENVANLLREIMRWHGTERLQDDISILAVELSIESGGGEPRECEQS